MSAVTRPLCDARECTRTASFEQRLDGPQHAWWCVKHAKVAGKRWMARGFPNPIRVAPWIIDPGWPSQPERGGLAKADGQAL